VWEESFNRGSDDCNLAHNLFFRHLRLHPAGSLYTQLLALFPSNQSSHYTNNQNSNKDKNNPKSYSHKDHSFYNNITTLRKITQVKRAVRRSTSKPAENRTSTMNTANVFY
jgi:hypothetical protein